MKKQELLYFFIALTVCLFSANAASEKNPWESTIPSFLQNGNFEEVKNGVPEGWGGRNFELIKKENGISVLLKGAASAMAVLTDYITDRTLYPPEKPVEIPVRFQASGKGSLNCMFYRYFRKNGKTEYLPTKGVGTYGMTADPCFYTGCFTIGAGENVVLAFHANKAFNKKLWQERLRIAHADSITCFSCCHHGWSYHPTKVGTMRGFNGTERPDFPSLDLESVRHRGQGWCRLQNARAETFEIGTGDFLS